MAVNLLPQTPPRTPDAARAASNTDAPADDAPTFAASLSLAKASDAPAPGKPATRAADATSETEDPDPPAPGCADALAAWVLAHTDAGLLAAAVPPAPASEVPDATSVAGGAADAGTPAPLDVLAASLALLEVTGAAGAPPAAEVHDTTAPLAESAPKIDAGRLGKRPPAPALAEGSSAAREPASLAPREGAELRGFAAAMVADARPDARAEAPAARKDAHAGTGAVTDIPASGTPAPVARPPVQLTIVTPALTPAWRDEVTRELTQLVVLRHDRAEIRLHPADLGPITVQIRMDGGQANLLIQAPQPATRDGLELALPQLRESLAEQGITLGQANVRDDRAAQDDARERPAFTARPAAGSEAAPIAAVSLRARLGLVDLFA